MTITATVTIADLISAYDDELRELREAYEDAMDAIETEFGSDAADAPIPSDIEGDRERLAALRQSASAYEDAGKTIQKRNKALELLAEDLDGEAFELRMLTGAQLMDIETDLKLKAQAQGIDQSAVQHYRKALVVDAATVDAPGGIPRDDDGSPQPSEAGNPLTLALYEQVQALNESGATDFRAPGFGDGDTPSPAVASSETPRSSPPASTPSPTADGETPASDTPDSGDS